jgi:short-subunit dehydrogenase
MEITMADHKKRDAVIITGASIGIGKRAVKV